MSIFLRSCEFFNGLSFLLGAILRQLPTTGAGTRLKATIKDLGEYSKTATDASFKQRAVKVLRKKMKKIQRHQKMILRIVENTLQYKKITNFVKRKLTLSKLRQENICR